MQAQKYEAIQVALFDWANNRVEFIEESRTLANLLRVEEVFDPGQRWETQILLYSEDLPGGFVQAEASYVTPKGCRKPRLLAALPGQPPPGKTLRECLQHFLGETVPARRFRMAEVWVYGKPYEGQLRAYVLGEKSIYLGGADGLVEYGFAGLGRLPELVDISRQYDPQRYRYRVALTHHSGATVDLEVGADLSVNLPGQPPPAVGLEAGLRHLLEPMA